MQDMTKGSPMRHLIKFSIPLLVGNVFQQLYSFTDTAIVGKTLGNDTLAAVGATGAVMFMVFGFFFGLNNGLAVVTGQRFGAGDEEGVRKSVAASLVISAGLTLLSTCLCVWLTPLILRWINIPAEIEHFSSNYLVVMFAGMWSLVFYGLVSSILRALGDSFTPLVFLVISSLLNVIMDLTFILCFGWGVSGAAWATVIAQALSGVLCLVYAVWKYPILRLHWCNWNVCRAFYWEHLRISLPMAFQFSITAIGIVVLQAALNELGTDYITATTVAGRLDQISIQPMFSFGIAIAAYTAQNYGARNLDRISRGVKCCSLLSLAFALVTGLITVIFPEELAALFMQEPDPVIIGYIRYFIIVNCSFYFVLTMLLVYRNVLQGLGHSFVPMVAGAAELIIRVAAAFLLVRACGFAGVCFAHPLAWIGATAILFADYLLVMRKLRRDGIPDKDGLVRRTERPLI